MKCSSVGAKDTLQKNSFVACYFLNFPLLPGKLILKGQNVASRIVGDIDAFGGLGVPHVLKQFLSLL